MSLRLEVPRDKPLGFWMLDDAIPYADYSGYNRTATSPSQPPKHTSLVKGASYAVVLTNAVGASFASPVFVQGKESEPFTLEVSARAIRSATGDQQVLGNTGRQDGIVVNGTRVSFVTKYLTTGEARCTYDLQVDRAFHAVAVHTDSKNSLYIDGVLVAEVDITEAQQADQFVATDNSLYSGQTATSNKLALNAVSVYNYALSSESIRRHYANAKDTIDPDSVAAMYNGSRIPLSKDFQNLHLSQTWSTAEDWSLGQAYNTVVEQDQLLPQFLNGVSVAGSWVTVVPLSGTTTLSGVNLNWDGVGATVETSLDGTTWETVTRGVNISSVGATFNPDGKVLHIRVSFPGGITNDTSFVDNLSVSAFKGGTQQAFGGWTVSVTNGYFEDERPVSELNENFGLQLNSGTLTLTPTSTDFTPAYTIEIWMMPRAALSTNLTSPSATYADGSVNVPLNDGEWQVRTYVFNAGRSGNITVTGTGQIGQVVIYPKALTQAQVDAAYQSYIGIPSVRFADVSAISVSESPAAAEIYEYDWAIEAAG